MSRYKFTVGLLLILSGLAIIMIMGSGKPPTDIPYGEWKARIAPIHVGWMVGLGACVLGLILILNDTFTRDRRVESIEREEDNLRQEILRMLAQAQMSQQELNQLVRETYASAGLFGLNIEQLNKVRNLVERKMAERE